MIYLPYGKRKILLIKKRNLKTFRMNKYKIMKYTKEYSQKEVGIQCNKN